MRALWNGEVIAESDDTVQIEGRHYFPMDAVKSGALVESETTTDCVWKGTANYYSVRVGEETNADAAWVYRDPKPEAASIKGRIAFWRGVEFENA